MARSLGCLAYQVEGKREKERKKHGMKADSRKGGNECSRRRKVERQTSKGETMADSRKGGNERSRRRKVVLGKTTLI